MPEQRDFHPPVIVTRPSLESPIRGCPDLCRAVFEERVYPGLVITRNLMPIPIMLQQTCGTAYQDFGFLFVSGNEKAGCRMPKMMEIVGRLGSRIEAKEASLVTNPEKSLRVLLYGRDDPMPGINIQAGFALVGTASTTVFRSR